MQIKKNLHMVTCIESPFVIHDIYIRLHNGVSLVKSAVEGPIRSVKWVQVFLGWKNVNKMTHSPKVSNHFSQLFQIMLPFSFIAFI